MSVSLSSRLGPNIKKGTEGMVSAVTARARNGAEIKVEPKSLEDLKSRLKGSLLLRDDAGYDDARSVWNAMIDRQPALIVRCLGVADVVAAVNFARDQGLLLSIKGGGHNIAGMAVCDGGLTLDMSAMRGVWVDPQNRTAHAQAGCLLGDVDRESQIHHLAPVLGFVSNTGIAGLTLGGGFGYLTRRFGWACDNVASMEVVTAEGRVVRASEKENNDLLWGLRGGGGNFGVVTGFDYRLHSVGPEILAGLIAWRAEDAAGVMDMYRSIVEQAPEELTCVLILRIAPPAPWLPKEIHGKPIVVFGICHSGQAEAAEQQFSSIKAFGSPVGNIVQRRSYVSQQSLLDATQPKGRRYYWKSDYLPRLSPDFLENLAAHAGRIVSPHSAILVFPIDGALQHLPEEHSAIGNRDARFVLNVAASWERAEQDDANIQWARAAWDESRRFSTGRSSINFQTEEEGGDRIRATYGNNYERLRDIKRRWDPDNLFRMNKNVIPSGA
jgi:FAD/FMN-containing dehydrogenase